MSISTMTLTIKRMLTKFCFKCQQLSTTTTTHVLDKQECQLVLLARLSSLVNVILGILELSPQLFCLSSLASLLLKSFSQISYHRCTLRLKSKGSFICCKLQQGSQSLNVLKTCCVIFSFSQCHISWQQFVGQLLPISRIYSRPPFCYITSF